VALSEPLQSIGAPGGLRALPHMPLASALRTNLLVALASALATLALFVLGYEAWQTVRYRAWRARYDNKGWLGTLTVPSMDPVLMWEYRPYGRHRSIATNRYGFRDEDFESPRKPAGVYRVAFVGDSVTLGLGVEADQTFERLLVTEAKSLAPALELQALNFGIDGYNTAQIAELVKTRVPPFEPDEVVYMMCLNDFDRSDSSAEKIRYFRKPKSFFLEDLEVLYRRLRGVEFHRYHFEKNKDATFAEILSMQHALPDGTRFRLVILPVFFEGAHDFRAYPLRDIHEAIRAFCGRNGIPVFDLLPMFESAGGDSAQDALDPWHLSLAGHRRVARALAPLMLADAHGSHP
jgi:lysophospholipase L1-like esterase